MKSAVRQTRANPLCVAVVGLRGIPDVMGGIETHVQALYGRMKGIDRDVRLVVTARKPYVGDRPYRYRGVAVLPVATIRNKYLETALQTLIALFVVRFRLKPDIVHLHAIGPGLFAPLARLMGMRVVFTHHGTDYEREKWGWLAKRVLRLGEKLAVMSAHQTIIVGKSVTEEMQARFPAKAAVIVHVPNGAEVPGGGAAADALATSPVFGELDLEPGRYFLAVGRLVPEKRFGDLIRAHARLAPADRWPLVIVGRADFEDAYSRRLRDMAGPGVIFAGFRSGAELSALYAGAGLFVLASSHEGLPIAGLEAMAAGAPVLFSDIRPNTDIGLPRHCYFTVGDVDDLAAKLAEPDHARRVPSAQALTRFDWSKIAARTLEILRLGAAPGRGGDRGRSPEADAPRPGAIGPAGLAHSAGGGFES